MPHAADSAKAFNRQLRETLRALGVRADDDLEHAFVCECGCGELAKLTLAEYDESGGARLEGHNPAL
jgi:hypothetical protein